MILFTWGCIILQLWVSLTLNQSKDECNVASINTIFNGEYGILLYTCRDIEADEECLYFYNGLESNFPQPWKDT